MTRHPSIHPKYHGSDRYLHHLLGKSTFSTHREPYGLPNEAGPQTGKAK
jgi:hypothetical protein